MEIIIVSLVVTLIILAGLFIGWLLDSFKGLKLNDETYLYEKQDHLSKPKRSRKRVRKK
jgi:hypothetical protein